MMPFAGMAAQVGRTISVAGISIVAGVAVMFLLL